MRKYEATVIAMQSVSPWVDGRTCHITALQVEKLIICDEVCHSCIAGGILFSTWKRLVSHMEMQMWDEASISVKA